MRELSTRGSPHLVGHPGSSNASFALPTRASSYHSMQIYNHLYIISTSGSAFPFLDRVEPEARNMCKQEPLVYKRRGSLSSFLHQLKPKSYLHTHF
ncbi:hypothetical protein CPB86DRAFT_357872 [Serendipita vermifera]|nr:hypothetical protein CPB86DRAFT_357872 [Serendipita vermifera]